MGSTFAFISLFLSSIFFLGISYDELLEVSPTMRVDCGPDPSINEEVCKSRGCLWTPNTDYPNIPWCHYPANTGYILENSVNLSNRLTLRKNPKSPRAPYGREADSIQFESQSIGAGVRVTIGAKGSYVPKIDLDYSPNIQSNEKLIVRTTNSSIFSFAVERPNGVRLWDTEIGGLLFADQFIQLATILPTDRIYGFGEHIHQTLSHDFTKYRTWPMFARDQPPNSGSENSDNLYGVHNFYLGLEPDGKAHGVFVLNSNAQEVTTGPAPHLVYRSIGGRFDVFFLPGPSPNDVITQYQQIVGRPFLPAYWALGFQFCRYGFVDLEDMKSTVKRIQTARIPFDVIYADIDYMDRFKDFTTGKPWEKLPEYTKQLHEDGMRLTLIFDPAIQADYSTFSRAKEQGADFVNWPRADLVQKEIQNLYPMAKDTLAMLAVVWPDRHVAFPDFYDETNKTNEWWAAEFERYYSEVQFDGIWIDMNEPAVFRTNGAALSPEDKPLRCPMTGPDSTLDNPPFRTMAAYHEGPNFPLCGKTLCMLGRVNKGRETMYDTKNLYGLKETIATVEAQRKSTKQRGQIVSRSTFPSSGKYGGHWLGDNTARWADLRTTVIGAQEFNIFGIPFVGSDVCGFIGASNEELCLRWQQLGAFHSFYRNHNDLNSPPQDPPQWPAVAQTTRIANLFRYRHLPYLYTLHFSVSLRGGTVVRPLFFEFPRDFETLNLGYEFMWGPAFLVAPAVYENIDEFVGYLPTEGEWFDVYEHYGSRVHSGRNVITAPRNSPAPVFVRGGHIIPRQAPGLTTTASRLNNFQLLVTLNRGENAAEGELFWDDGISWAEPGGDLSDVDHYHFVYKFTVDSSKAQLDILLKRKPKNRLSLPPLEEIEVFGYPHNPSFRSIKVNNRAVSVSARESFYSPITQLLRIRQPQNGFVKLNDHLDKWTIIWSNV